MLIICGVLRACNTGYRFELSPFYKFGKYGVQLNQFYISLVLILH